VKIRGHRVEPAEVAAVVGAHPTVGAAAVVSRPGPDGKPRLVAYVVRAAGAVIADVEELRGYVAGHLPEAMVPSFFVDLPALPHGPNGKLDRAALPDPEPADVPALYTEPRTETERLLARMWSELLELPAVSTTGGFFSLGGHSLLATRIVARIRDDFGVDLPVAEILRSGATIQSLAAMVEQLQLSQRHPDELATLVTELEGLSVEAVAELLATEETT
jgi:acyl carrier protein